MFPIHDPVLIFSIVMAIVLVAPLLAEKIKLPGIIGLIFAGVIIGPHLFGILERDKTIELLSTIGILYIMFLAGLEINIEQVKQNKHYSIVFGLFTFSIPLVIGTTSGILILDMSILAAILLASMFSSHTLLTFPIVSRLDLAKKRSVTTTIGGTIITDTLAFMVLAVILAFNSGELTFFFWLKLIISTIIFVAIVMFILPIISRWFFRHFSSKSGIEEYAFVITAFFISAYLSHLAGLEPIIGAFLAGLSLNSLIPEKSVLMNRIQFVGNSLFIPFFLVSVGMLIDPKLFITDLNAIKVSLVMIVVAIIAKLIAAYLSGKILKFTKIEIGLIFSMSVNQAAATLAAVMVGYRIGIFDDSVLAGTIMMIIVTCLVGSIFTQKFSKKLIISSKETSDFSSSNLLDRILIPIHNPSNLNYLMDLAFLLHPKNSTEPLYPLYVAIEGANEKQQIIDGENILTKTSIIATSVQKQIIPLTKIDVNVSSAISKAISEHRITKVVFGWNELESIKYAFFDTVAEQFVKNSHEMIFISRIVQPLSIMKRILLIIPPLINKQNGFIDTFKSLKKLSSEISTKLVIIAEEETSKEIQNLFSKAESIQFIFVSSWKKINADIEKIITPDDMIIQMIARQGRLAWRLSFDKLPQKLKQSFPKNNLIVVYPYYHLEEDGDNANENILEEVPLLKTIPKNNFFLNVNEVTPESIFQKIIENNSFENEGKIFKQLLEILNEYPIELTPEVNIIHIHTPQISEYQIYIAVNRDGFLIQSTNTKPKVIIILLSPENLPVQQHLNILSEISKMIMVKDFVKNILTSNNYEHFIKLMDNVEK